MNIAEILGYRIQTIRLAKKLTQEELAKKIDKSVHYISAIERGTRSPRLTTLVDLMHALQITPNELFCDLVGQDSTTTTFFKKKEREKEKKEREKEKIFIAEFIEKFYLYTKNNV